MAKVTLQNQAYRMILERIIRHEFKPGEPMRESKLAAALGISVTPVREALHQLEREGWLETFPCRGAFLRKITPREIEEFRIMRETLELACVDAFLKHAEDEDCEALRRNIAESEALLEELRSAPPSPDEMDMRWRFIDSAFHQLIISGTHSARLIAEAEKWSMQIQVYMQSQHDERTCEERLDSKSRVLRQHQAILLALEMARKEQGIWVEAARTLVRAHLPGAGRFDGTSEGNSGKGRRKSHGKRA